MGKRMDDKKELNLMRKEDPKKWYIVTLPMSPAPYIVQGHKLLAAEFGDYLWVHKFGEVREATKEEVVLYGTEI